MFAKYTGWNRFSSVQENCLQKIQEIYFYVFSLSPTPQCHNSCSKSEHLCKPKFWVYIGQDSLPHHLVFATQPQKIHSHQTIWRHFQQAVRPYNTSLDAKLWIPLSEIAFHTAPLCGADTVSLMVCKCLNAFGSSNAFPPYFVMWISPIFPPSWCGFPPCCFPLAGAGFSGGSGRLAAAPVLVSRPACPAPCE